MTESVQKPFEAQVNHVLRLVTNSLYSNREVFLRELISNASDAMEKLRLQALTDKALADVIDSHEEMAISIKVDGTNKTLTIQDTGIGMSQDEVVSNLGTIAKSGTRDFLEQFAKAKTEQDQSSLIGQFGVGFYSAFVVADRVKVCTRRADLSADQAVCWESDGQSAYTLTPTHQEVAGTIITLTLKEDAAEFLEDWKLRQVVTKYSDYLSFPIKLWKEAPADQQDKPEEERETSGCEQINRAKALWSRSKSEISDEEYQAFYKHISHDFEDPVRWLHKRVEGNYDYTLLLFLPKRAPFDLFQRDQARGLKLYVQRVFIMDNVEQFLPNYLRFVRGVIDSQDLPLNVSREILQTNRVIDVIKQGATKYVLDSLTKMAKDDAEQYQAFWLQFGQVLKEGIGEDFQNQDKLKELLRFASSHDDSGTFSVSLSDYLGRMPSEQDKIYYVVSEDYQSGLMNPHMEYFKRKGIEVLVLTDRIDEWMVTRLSKYQEKTLQAITQTTIEETDEDLKVDEAEKNDWQDLLDRLKAHYQDRVKDVKLTKKLSDSPCCVAGDSQEMTLHLRRILKEAGQNVPEYKPTLELNPDHPIIQSLASESSEEQFALMADILLGQSILAEGGELAKPAQLVKDIYRWLASRVTS